MPATLRSASRTMPTAKPADRPRPSPVRKQPGRKPVGRKLAGRKTSRKTCWSPSSCPNSRIDIHVPLTPAAPNKKEPPIESVKPVEPVEAVKPVKPVEPVHPVVPILPQFAVITSIVTTISAINAEDNKIGDATPLLQQRRPPAPGDSFDTALEPLEMNDPDTGEPAFPWRLHLLNDDTMYVQRVGENMGLRLDDALAFPVAAECPNLVTAPDELYADAVFVKRPSTYMYNTGVDEQGQGTSNPAAFPWYALHQARVLCHLHQHPHPHLVHFYGCRVRRGRITGLVLEKLPRSLQDLSPDELAALDQPRFLQQLRSAVQHLHALGYAHNDIKPGNIMVRATGQPVLIDFDACVPIGWLTLTATAGWSPWYLTIDTTGAKAYAAPDNDYYALDILEERMGDHAKLTGCYRASADGTAREVIEQSKEGKAEEGGWVQEQTK